MNNESQEERCIYSMKDGTHFTDYLRFYHQANEEMFYWIPTCPKCGWIDTKGMVKQLSLWKRIKLIFI